MRAFVMVSKAGLQIHRDVRLNHKPTKRNIKRFEKSLKEYDIKFRMNSKNGAVKKENYLRIDNTNLSPEETAKKIKKKFQL